MRRNILQADFDDALQAVKREIFATFNCVQVGKIETYNYENQSAEIQIQVKARYGDGKIIDYPLLVDCPVFVLQGGGAYLEFPIEPGDTCLVLFNDRDIDTWWTSENYMEPKTRRKHDLSDGFALVGVRPRTRPLPLSGDKVHLEAGPKVLDLTGSEAHLNGDSKSFVTHAELNTALQSFITALNTHTHPTAAIGPPSPPTAPMSIDISAAETTTIKTGG